MSVLHKDVVCEEAFFTFNIFAKTLSKDKKNQKYEIFRDTQSNFKTTTRRPTRTVYVHHHQS